MIARAIADSDEEASDDDGAGVVIRLSKEVKTGADTPLDPPAAAGTGSTERLRRQLFSAEQDCWAVSGSRNMEDKSYPSAATSAGQAPNKRRHTATVESEPSQAPNSSVKRSKTSNASSMVTKSPAQFATDENFTHTSQIAMFAEHSSALLPRGSLQEDFLDHEPSVMFPQSGSTMADDSSAQQHMLDALNERNRPLLNSSVVNALPSNGFQNSSLPCSAFGSNGQAGSSGERQGPAAEANIEDVPEGQHTVADMNGTPSDEYHAAVETQVVDTIQTSERVENFPKKAASPMVEIRQPARRASVSSRNSTAGSPSAPTRRKTNSEEQQMSSDALNSDDRAIGLPKERYQPRPTKRRATAVLEEPADFSIRPEKAAKIKRTKTTDAVLAKLHQDEPSITQRAVSAISDGNSNAPTALEVIHNEGEVYANEKASSSGTSQGAHTAISDAPEQSTELSAPRNGPDTAKGLEAEQSTIHSPLVPPPARKKASMKAKRAQTTIFEDHVEFVGSQRSPNLSQQQASRKAALKAAKSGTNKRKPKAVVSDDEEDELGACATDLEDRETPEQPPKKRGRGRPPKTTVKVVQKSAEKVLEDSDCEGDKQVEMDESAKQTNNDVETDSASNNNNAMKHTADEDERNNTSAPKEGPQREVETANRTFKDAQPASTPEQPATVTRIPTPSPEKENAPPPQHQPPKGSPTSHSPIQGSSKVPLRVGLSKRQRIPSLLKIMRPPKQ